MASRPARARELGRLTLVLSVSALYFFVRVLLHFALEDAGALWLVKACDLEDLGRVEPGVCLPAHDCYAVAGHFVDGHARIACLVDGGRGCRHGESWSGCWREGGALEAGRRWRWLWVRVEWHNVLGLRVSLFKPWQQRLYACRRVAEMRKGESATRRSRQKLAEFPRSSPTARGCTLSLFCTVRVCRKTF